ncbi:MAG: hypothetical protein HW389_3082 [Bacteroidetes bacterium]|nr:hypothetical protein [Bacteroidota bacterium]
MSKQRKWGYVLGAITVCGLIFFVFKSNITGSSVKVIAVVNLQKHPILDAVEDGLMQELKRMGYIEGENSHFVMRNANGDQQRVATIANEIAAQNPDIAVAISTPVAQSIVKSYRGLVVFGALTDPISAGVITSLSVGDLRVTGTSDALPYSEQMALIRKIHPNAKRLGLLYNPGEAASQHAIKEIRKVAPELQFELVEGAVSSTNDVYPVAQNIGSRVDVLLISTDNTVAAGIAGAVKVAVEKKVPLYAFDSGSVEKGAIAAVSPGYYDIGVETARLVDRVLRGERNIPTVFPKGGEIYLNTKAAELMGMKIPADITSKAKKIFRDLSQ